MRRSSVGLRGGAAQRPSHANGSREKHIWIAQVCLVCLRVAIGSCVRGDNDYRSDVAPWPMTFGKLKPLMEGGEKPPNYFIFVCAGYFWLISTKERRGCPRQSPIKFGGRA